MHFRFTFFSFQRVLLLGYWRHRYWEEADVEDGTQVHRQVIYGDLLPGDDRQTGCLWLQKVLHRRLVLAGLHYRCGESARSKRRHFIQYKITVSTFVWTETIWGHFPSCLAYNQSINQSNSISSAFPTIDRERSTLSFNCLLPELSDKQKCFKMALKSWCRSQLSKFRLYVACSMLEEWWLRTLCHWTCVLYAAL